MSMICFLLWMLGYPLVCSIGSYLSYLSGKRYSVQVIGIASLITIVIWFVVGSLIWSKI